ncbi:MAG: M1 family metallopeptidase [Candidatus Marinimicrobia bacterium]|nr:M1 family metallopeptidase [Candidatus Neomarinimicrobiota bacterium]
MRQMLLSIFLISIISAQNADYFQQYVAYDIEVTLNDSDHTLSAFEKITYKNNSPDTLNFIWFHIWPNAYKNDSTAFAKQKGSESKFAKADSSQRGFLDSLDFSVNGQKANWTYHDEWIDVVKLELNQPLSPGNSIIIETPFYVKIPDQFSRLGHTGQHYEITQWYPKPAVYDHKGWHPMPYLNMGEFYSEFGTFDVKISLPKDYRIMATGDIVNGEAEYAWLDSLVGVADSIHRLPEEELKQWTKSHSESTGDQESVTSHIEMKTLHFHQENVHDFAWFADKTWLVRKGKLELGDEKRKVTLWSFYMPKNAEQWSNSIEYLHDSGYWYSRYYGDYPYNHITAVDGDMSAGGGMEYPNITVISSMPSKAMLEMVIMHEVGHNWFYGILGSNERYHTWMDEGLNEYSSIRYWEDKYGDTGERFVISEFIQDKLGIAKNLQFSFYEYFAYAMSAKSKNVQPLNLRADEYKEANYGLNYNKVSVFTRFLQHYLGEDKMDEIMQDYYETWKFRHPYPEDFQAIFEKHTDKDLSWYFDGVLETTDYLDFSIKKTNNQYTISNNGDLKTPVEVVFFGQDHIVLERRWIEGINWRETIEGPKDTWYAIIDPDEHMPDINRANNATRRELHFNWVWDQPTFYDHDINILPWLFSYNHYNGWSPGMLFYKGFLFGYDNKMITARPMWDIENNELVGKVGITKMYDPNDRFDFLRLRITGSKYEGRTGLKLSYSGEATKEGLNKVFLFGLNYSNLDSTALDPNLYTSGVHTTLLIKYGLSKNFDGVLNQAKWDMGINGSDYFSKLWTEANLKFKFTKKIRTDIRIWAGSFLNDKDVPKQYRSYLSGGVDPYFSSLVMDRTGKSGFAVLHNQYIQDGPSIRGLVLDEKGIPLSASGFTWGINITPSIPLYLDVAGGQDFNETYSAVGLKLGPIIIPLYQSWEVDQKSAKDWQWVKERIRISIRVEGLNLQNSLF